MKLKYIIGILALLLLTVGTASAYVMTETTDDYTTDFVPIKVNVDYVDKYVKVTVLSPLNGQTYTDSDGNSYTVSNVAIQNIWLYNPDNPVVTPGGITDLSGASISGDWNIDKSTGGAGYFGTFTTKLNQNNENDKTIGTIQIELKDNVGALLNDQGYGVVTHVAFQLNGVTKIVGCSGKVSHQVPEFPTVALPIAAILGLMFVFGRRKQE